jgi:biotin operon repressor
MPSRTSKSDEPIAPREHSKADRLLAMLRTGTGASLEDMTGATGWQPHTVRAAMTGLRKRGYAIERHVEGNASATVPALAAPRPLTNAAVRVPPSVA